jgi:hypothetical protein
MCDFRKYIVTVDGTLYITPRIFDRIIGCSRYTGKGESVVHLMLTSMFCRLDPLLNALFYNSYGIVNLLMQGRVCMCKVDSSKARTGNVSGKGGKSYDRTNTRSGYRKKKV